MPDEVTPEVVETPAPEPVVEAPTPTGPWAADAAEYFGDDTAAIANFDRYMREKQQPRVTELENHPGRKLWNDFENNAEDTLAEVFAEIYEDDEDKVAAFKGIFGETATPAEVVEATTPDGEAVPDWAKPLLAEAAEKADLKARETSEAEYAADLATMRTAHADLTDADMELIHPFIAIAGDLEEAYGAYAKFKSDFAAANGGATPEPEPTPEPPAVLGTTGAPAAVPPVAVEYRTISDAIDGWLDEKRTQQPPPVI
jgi:hypothetical protein